MARHPLTILAAKGGWPVEFVVQANGDCPALEFLNGECESIREGGRNKPNSTARAKFMFLFQNMATSGRLSPKRFKAEMRSFFAFSHEVRNVQIRFPCFRDGSKWIVTHGFIKPGSQRGRGRWPREQIERAESLRDEYISRKRAVENGGQ